MSGLYEAITFAKQAHAGQVRKYTGAPYITHPLRVMNRTLLHPFSGEWIAMVAVLHDVVEDCGVTYYQISSKFDSVVSRRVKELTNTSKKESPNLNRAARKKLDRDRLRDVSEVAKIIKLIDRIDNLGEIPLTDPKAVEFLKVYLPESELLCDALKGTDASLEAELMDLVQMLGRKIDLLSRT